MKATGIVRRIDDLGRVVIPKEVRRMLKINDGDPMEIFTNGNEIILRPYYIKCPYCGRNHLDMEEEDYIEKDGEIICKECLKYFARKANEKI